MSLPPRITMRLSGGLGNQLFQYAAGRAAALALGSELALDRSAFRRDRAGRRYALGCFPICAAHEDLAGGRRAIADCPGLWRLARATGLAPRAAGARFLFDRLRGFDPRLREAARHLIAIGYWQDERYFLDARERLLDELDPAATFSPGVRALGRSIAEGETLAVHVRRGDFAHSSSAHGTCGLDYYRTALAWITGRTNVGRVLFFSDDPTAAAQLLAELAPPAPAEVLSGTDSRGEEEEFWLMSRCRHLIIANSSYSWWAAWLADRGGMRTGTLVACPARWYRPAAGPIPHPAPDRWHRVAVG